MKINYKKILAIALPIFFFLPLLVSAAGLIPSDCEINGCMVNGKFVPGNGFGAFATLINNIINWFIGISVSVAAITFSIAGANILMHPDNAEEIKKAKNMFTKTVIGMLLVLGAWLIIHTIVATLVNKDTDALRFLEK